MVGPDERTSTDSRAVRWLSSRGLLLAALVLAALWWLALALMAWLTANPVTINVWQVYQADVVVQAMVVDPQSGAIEVSREWKNDRTSLPGQSIVKDTALAEAVPGNSYLLPLTRSATGEWQVTRAALRTPLGKPQQYAPPYIYPATEEAIAQLEEVLAAGNRRDDPAR